MNASRFLTFFLIELLLLLPACMPAPQPGPAAVTPMPSTTAGQVTATPQSATASAANGDRLQRGINLMGWFWLGPQDPAQIDTRFVDKDFALLHELGFTFVRLPIDLGSVMDASRPDLLDPAKLAHLDRALDMILAHDLAVIVDLHSISIQASDASNYSGDLDKDPKLQETFIRFWQSFARHLSGRDPRLVYLELMNEPVFDGHTQDWLPLQKRLLDAARQGAPELTLIATSANWSNLDTFLQMTPVSDPNVIYNFHFYDPFLFTHQGATWTWDAVRPLRQVPYPSNPQAVKAVIDSINDPAIKGYLQDYGNQRWDAAKIEQTLQQAADWGKRYHVRVICDEFGAYKQYSKPEDRQAWVHDVRTAFEKLGIGWSMWEYDSGFGLVERAGDFTQKPSIAVDIPLARALGLAEIQNNP